MGKVVCIGEALVDFVPDGDKLIPMAGGAPANVCACVAKLGGHGVFLGKLSTDEYGKFIASELENVGVDMRSAVYGDFKTAYSTVALKDGERSFSFFRENTADLNLLPDEIPQGLFERGDVLHFCSVCLVDCPTKSAHEKAIELAKAAGATVSFDVNLRPSLWDSEENMRRAVNRFLGFADIVKVSDEELGFLADGCVSNLFKLAANARIIIVTKGAEGAEAYLRVGGEIRVSAYCAKPVDTTGAGDCFIGSVLFRLTNTKYCDNGNNEFRVCNDENLTDEFVRSDTPVRSDDILFTHNVIKSAMEFAARACSISVTRKGAVSSYPTIAELESFCY